MAEEQTSVNHTQLLTSVIEQSISEEFGKCVIVSTNVSKFEDSDEEHISTSILMGLMGTVMVKIGSELSSISMAMMKNHVDKHSTIYKELDDPTEVIRHDFDIIKNPEILELTSNDIDPMKIAKYLASILEQYLSYEISKCKLVRKTQLKNDGGEEYIPVSMLDSLIESWVDNFRSEALEMVSAVIKKLEDKHNYTIEKLQAQEEDRRSIIKESEDLLKSLDKMKNEARITKNYDMLTRLDNMKVPKLRKMQQLCPKDAKALDELHASYEKKRPSIICRFTNRNKKLEIISTRRQLKGKEGNPLPGAGI